MQDHRSEEVPRSRRREVSIVGTVYDCLVHRNVCSAVHRLEAFRRIMHRHWPAVARTVAAPSINRRTHRHQVRPLFEHQDPLEFNVNLVLSFYFVL